VPESGGASWAATWPSPSGPSPTCRTATTNDRRLKGLLAGQGCVILAIDGLQPDIGHEALWVIRDSLSGGAAGQELAVGSPPGAGRPAGAGAGRPAVPVAGVVSDGQRSIRKAVAEALPGVPFQPCQVHHLREAARPIFEAGRHAKKVLKRKVRGIERSAEGRTGPEAEAVRG
jgi:hypothetical protein